MSNNAERKIRKSKEKQVEKEVSSKLNMFDRLPDECNACKKPYDKKSKEMARTWFVHVKHEEKVVRLFCPDCWSKAVKAIKYVNSQYEVEIVQEDN